MKRLHHDSMQGIGNRQSSMHAKKCLMWCAGCDCNMVSPGGTCSNCGHKDVSGVGKKRKRIIKL